MGDKFKQFLAAYINQYWDFDGYYGYQCVDLVQFWSKYIGGPRFWGNAKDIYNQAGNFYTPILNTPSAVPQAGDIVVWSGWYNAVYNIPGNGHTGIATGKGDVNTFECFEQNDAVGTVSHLRTYNYYCVIGWLRPKSQPLTAQEIVDKEKSIINTSISDSDFRNQARALLQV